VNGGRKEREERIGAMFQLPIAMKVPAETLACNKGKYSLLRQKNETRI